MRYLITTLAISAFALMAGTAQAACPDSDTDGFTPVNDTALLTSPASSSVTISDIGDCNTVDWMIKFDRTGKDNETHTRVLIKIDGTNVQGDSTPGEEWVDSEDYPLDSKGQSKEGSDSIWGTSLQSHLELSSNPRRKATGHFNNMEVEYSIYQQQ